MSIVLVPETRNPPSRARKSANHLPISSATTRVVIIAKAGALARCRGTTSSTKDPCLNSSSSVSSTKWSGAEVPYARAKESTQPYYCESWLVTGRFPNSWDQPRRRGRASVASGFWAMRWSFPKYDLTSTAPGTWTAIDGFDQGVSIHLAGACAPVSCLPRRWIRWAGWPGPLGWNIQKPPPRCGRRGCLLEDRLFACKRERLQH